MSHFNEYAFKSKVDAALKTVKKVLHNERHPTYADEVPHQYDDKYILAEFMSSTAIASQIIALEYLGVDDSILKKMKEWSKKRSVTLRFSSSETCTFIKKTSREVENKTKHVTEKSGIFGGKTEHKVVTRIDEWHWQFTVDYKLVAYEGANANDALVLRSRKAETKLLTTSESQPYPKKAEKGAFECNITAVLKHLDELLNVEFKIDRQHEDCHTPRRNPDVEKLIDFFREYRQWATRVNAYFKNDLFRVQQKHGIDLSAISAADLFVPILPVFEDPKEQARLGDVGDAGDADDDAVMEDAGVAVTPGNPDEPKEKKEKSKRSKKKGKSSGDDDADAVVLSSKNTKAVREAAVLPDRELPAESPVLRIGDVNRFLAQQRRSFDASLVKLAKVLDKQRELITTDEASLCVALEFASPLFDMWMQSIDYIESMLHKQIVAAVGKEVGVVDLIEYMQFHQRKLFRKHYAPHPFCYAVRRPDHYPEGTLSIEATLDSGEAAQPIQTCVRREEAGRHAMEFALNAATNVRFYGERYLHAYVMHQFGGQKGQRLSLVARARQFSSFILLVGKINSPTSFEPTAACIVKDKDELTIPLDLETIPTPKEFRDAIESLSPEQQRFCKAFRQMQLASTLFGVLVVQIKPQLEKLLRLNDDALTKEIRLNQDLMEMFIKYQVPSDLMSFGGDADTNGTAKLEKVKGHVGALQSMIEDAKKKEIEDTKAEASKRVLEAVRDEPEMMMMAEESLSYDSMVMGGGGGGGNYGGMKKMAKMARKRNAAPQMARRAMAAPAAPMAMAAMSAPPPPMSAPGGAPPPRQQQQQQQSVPQPKPAAAQPKSDQPKPVEQQPSVQMDVDDEDNEVGTDYTALPGQLDALYEKLDTDSALRPTIIKTGDTWTKRSQAGLLSPLKDSTMGADEQKSAKEAAFDLLDALSKSGALSIDQASLHVVVAATHCFDKMVMDTLVQDNVNPIEKIERSVLIQASVIHAQPVVELVRADRLESVQLTSPMLLENGDADAN